MGAIIGIETISSNSTNITCEISSDTPLPTETSFILFSKENIVNTSSITGYYNEVEFRNNSTKKAELFAASCEVAESSK